jgi:hypothetical protein
VGACCDYVQQICNVIPQSACPNLIGYLWLGAGTTCNPNPCPGACCNPSTGNCTNVAAANCPAGSIFTAWANCTQVICAAVGACCNPNLVIGTCAVLTQAQCNAVNGTWMGAGTGCNPSACPGACCTGQVFGGVGNICLQTTQINCQNLGGQWQGLGAPCSNPPFSANLTTCCWANCDGVNGVTVNDLFCYLAAFFGNLPSADCDGNNIITVNDIFCFLAAFFSGCQ